MKTGVNTTELNDLSNNERRVTHIPTCASVMEMVGKLFIRSLSAGGGPVFSNWFNNCM